MKKILFYLLTLLSHVTKYSLTTTQVQSALCKLSDDLPNLDFAHSPEIFGANERLMVELNQIYLEAVNADKDISGLIQDIKQCIVKCEERSRVPWETY